MPPRNPYICIVIVAILGGAGILNSLGVILLALNGKEAPQAIVALASAALGALASFLVQVPRGTAGATGGHQASNLP